MLVPAQRPCQIQKASFMATQIVSISQPRASIREDLLAGNWMKQKMAQNPTAARKQGFISQKTAMSQKSPWGGGRDTGYSLWVSRPAQSTAPFSIKDVFKFLMNFCRTMLCSQWCTPVLTLFSLTCPEFHKFANSIILKNFLLSLSQQHKWEV